MLRESLQVGPPAVDLFCLDLRLAQMIKHKRLFRHETRQFDSGRQLVGKDEQVVGEAKLVQRPEAANKVVTQQKPRIGLVLNNMPYPDEFWGGGKSCQVLGDCGTPQVDPADDALDERIGRSKLEQPVIFCERLASLHGDRASNPERPGHCLEIGREIIPSQPLHARADPRILSLRIAPEMLMGVNGHDGFVLPTITRPPAGKWLGVW